jgi:hypothetical protein
MTPPVIPNTRAKPTARYQARRVLVLSVALQRSRANSYVASPAKRPGQNRRYGALSAQVPHFRQLPAPNRRRNDGSGRTAVVARGQRKTGMERRIGLSVFRTTKPGRMGRGVWRQRHASTSFDRRLLTESPAGFAAGEPILRRCLLRTVPSPTEVSKMTGGPTWVLAAPAQALLARIPCAAGAAQRIV